jgi:hypothetical protein
MKKKKIIEILNKVNEIKVKDQRDYNKIALALNLSTQEELNRKLEVKNTKNNYSLFKLIMLYTCCFIFSFLVYFSFLFYGFKSDKYQNNPVIPENEILEEIFVSYNCHYFVSYIYDFELHNVLGYVYIGANDNNQVLFVLEFNESIYDYNINIEAQDSTNIYYANNFKTNEYYLVIEASQELVYNFIISYSINNNLEFSNFILDVTNFILG